MSSRPTTVGVLYPGEMGAAVCAVLRRRGIPVLTTLDGRTDATAARAAACGAQAVDSLSHLVGRCDVVISLVSPSAAEEVARAWCDAARLAPPGAIYVDVNSIGPAKAAAIAARVEACGRSFVDASINGLARNLTTGGTLYMSGARSAEVAELFGDDLRVRMLGDEPGRASAMKMLLGGLSKGMCALFAELALLAERLGMLDELLEATTRTYPGVMTVVNRMVPTYARHAERRHTEMSELLATARDAGAAPGVVDAACRLHAEIARAFPAGGTDGDAGLASFLRAMAGRLEAVQRA
jgi:3-hydroxyisobutyrate dehydrogenase-like beta-hydroxyacid dehydrogenase